MMSAMKKLLNAVRYVVIAVAFASGFATGAIFGETVIAKSDSPTVLTFFLAGQTEVPG